MKTILNILLIAIVLLFTGCSTLKPLVRVEYGYGAPVAIAKIMNDYETGTYITGREKPGLDMDGHYTSIKAGVAGLLSEHVELSLALGPVIFAPSKGPRGEYYGVDITPRLTYTRWRLQPYIEGLIGIGRLEHHWPGEATKFQFGVGGTVGVSIPIHKSLNFDLGYRLYHLSNGSAIFGSPTPNAGYNTDLVLFGFQYKF